MTQSHPPSDRARSRVVLHVGIPKTGSTAIQVALVRNRDWLEDRGIHYPPSRSDRRAREGRLMSGNGVELLSALTANAANPPSLSAFCRSAADRLGAQTLWSSEALFRSNPERLAEFRDQLDQFDIRLSVVAFVRNVAGHALSSYSEMVKAALLQSTFSDYISGRTANYNYAPKYDRLRRFVGVLGLDDVIVLHYDTQRNRLLQELLSCMGISDFTGLNLPSERINRSLTADELRIMRHINQQLSDRAAGRRISSRMLSDAPHASTPPVVSRDDLRILESLYSDEVDWVNRTFFGSDVLQVAGDQVISERSVEEPLTDDELKLITKLVGDCVG